MAKTRRQSRPKPYAFDLLALPCDPHLLILNQFVSDHDEGTKGEVRRLGILRLLAKHWAKGMSHPLYRATLKVMLEKREAHHKTLTSPLFHLHKVYTTRSDERIGEVFLACMANCPNGNGLPALKSMAGIFKSEEEAAARLAAKIPDIPDAQLASLVAIFGNLVPDEP